MGDYADDPAIWPTYIVAHLPHLRQEKGEDGKNWIVYEVFVAREAEWPGFELPEEIKRVERRR